VTIPVVHGLEVVHIQVQEAKGRPFRANLDSSTFTAS
jgi:hypothetical protein